METELKKKEKEKTDMKKIRFILIALSLFSIIGLQTLANENKAVAVNEQSLTDYNSTNEKEYDPLDNLRLSPPSDDFDFHLWDDEKNELFENYDIWKDDPDANWNDNI